MSFNGAHSDCLGFITLVWYNPILLLLWAELSSNLTKIFPLGHYRGSDRAPVGWSGKSNQNPNPSDPAALFPYNEFSGDLIQ